MHNEKSYFRTQNGSLAICHIGVITIKQFDHAQYAVQYGRSTVNLHRGRATKRFIFCGQMVWNLMKSTEEWGFSMVRSDFHLFGPMKEHLWGQKFFRWRRGNGGSANLNKGEAKNLFSRGHPQACGQLEQVCCEAGGLCRKIRHKIFCN